MNELNLSPLYGTRRIDTVNDKIKINQYSDGLTFGTDALLLAGYIKSMPNAKAIEFGGGTGIISLLLSARGKAATVDIVEAQPDFAALIDENIVLNRMEDRLFTVKGDVRDPAVCPGEYDLVFTNPPYMKTDSGYPNRTDRKNIARHEVLGDISDFCLAASKRLKYGGRFYCVYLPERMTDLLCAMRAAGIEPKRLTLVCPDPTSSPSLLLAEGRRGGRGGVKITPSLFLYTDKKHTDYSSDMDFILENGIFPPHFETANRKTKGHEA